MKKSDEEEIKKEFQLERVILFSDAVFAIIITIMVLDIRLPEDIKYADAIHVKKAFLALVPKAFGYGLSFFFVAMFWFRHLTIFSHLKDYDNKLLIYNLLYLFSVSLFPFVVTLISGNVGLESAAYGWGIYAYATVILVSTLFQTLLSRYLVINRERLCFEPDKVTDVLKYRALKYNFIAIPATGIILFGIGWLDYKPYYSVVIIGIYGAILGRLFKKFYPEKNGSPVIVRLFTAIKSKRKKRLLKPVAKDS